jgi:hypothetical protein
MSESLTWVKSSYSSTGNCVEIAGQPDRVLIRDTKDQSGPLLSISAEVWHRFTCQVKLSLVVASAWVSRRHRGALILSQPQLDGAWVDQCQGNLGMARAVGSLEGWPGHARAWRGRRSAPPAVAGERPTS